MIVFQNTFFTWLGAWLFFMHHFPNTQANYTLLDFLRNLSSYLSPASSHLYDVWYSLILVGKSVFSGRGFYPFKWQDAVTHALSSPEITRLFWTCWRFRRRKIFRTWCSKFAPNKCRISVVWNFFSAIFHKTLIFCILSAREIDKSSSDAGRLFSLTIKSVMINPRFSAFEFVK